MTRYESKKKMLDWQRTQRLGRRRVDKASKDPVARSKLLEEARLPVSSLGSPSLHSSNRDTGTNENITPVRLPSFLLSSPDSVSQALTSKPGYSFFKFPPEIRDMIYQYAVQYPTCLDLFASYYSQKEKRSRFACSGIKVELHTPAVLLLCKQITREALAILRSQTFVIDRIPPFIHGSSLPLPITDFISIPTLQNIRFFEFKVAVGEGNYGSAHVWRRVLENVLDAWAPKNSVVRLGVMIKLCNLAAEGLWWWELQEYEMLVDKINNFEFRHAAKPGTVQYEHWILDVYYAYRTGYRSGSLGIPFQTIPGPTDQIAKKLQIL
ncbi:hypothetical protein DL765_009412 [Monosporascus sp. GIB2]|nr:hypothetical protein DL765_009412 [Monosporascus sp. GIB2]